MSQPSKKSNHKPKYLEILDSKRQEVFKNLSISTEHVIYLAGGTAIAFYLNHRSSVDFDLYTNKHFESGGLIKKFIREFQNYDTYVSRDIDDTFYLTIDGISMSCFYYDYPLIRDLTEFESVNIASLEDLTAMKCISIVQRGSFRDFVDIYFLMNRFGLQKMIDFTKEKYSNYDEMAILKGLIYFEDAEATVETDLKRIEVFDKDLSWDKIKNYITDQVKLYQQKSFKGE